MRSKFILTVAASLLAGTIAAGAQQSGAPSGEKDRTGQPTDGGVTSTTPNRQGTQGQGGGNLSGSGTVKKSPAMKDTTPAQPGGISPSAPPQGADGGADTQPRPK